jgi:uncharacterized protein (TIGR04255 family)
MHDAKVRMSTDLPKFSDPPVVESVIGVQFAPIAGYSSAVAGRFWGIHLGKEWTKTTEAPRIPDQFERFENEALWTPPTVIFQQVPPGQSNRLQFTSANEDRMIQIQDSRFILNWRKQPNGAYPKYHTLFDEFMKLFQNFSSFVSEAGLGNIEPNAWELTYVNHIMRGDLWNSPLDFSKVVPGLKAVVAPGCNFESMSADWRYTLSNQRGRLYASVRHIKVVGNVEAMMIQLLTRGGVSVEENKSLDEGIMLGHEATARYFTALTSLEAQARWGKA